MGFLSPTFANAPMDLEGKKPAPSSPIYSGEAHGSFTPSPGTALSLPNTSSSLVVLGKPCRRNANSTTTPSCCRSSPSTSPLPLLDQEGGDVPGLYVC